MILHSTKLPISRVDLYSISNGNLSSYYDYEEVDDPKIASYYISKNKLIKYSNTVYAKVDDNGNITDIVSIRKPTCKIVVSVNNLTELKRLQIIGISKSDTKSRYVRRKEIQPSDIVYRSIDFQKFIMNGTLSFKFKVRNYDVTIEIDGMLDYFKKHLNNKPTYKNIRSYISKAIDSNDIKIDCTCPDFIYRFAYTATVGGYKANSPENRPSNITNPGLKGSACKHILYLINNKSWIVKYVSLIDIVLKLQPMILQ